MTEPEFRQWFRHHSSHFPGIASWLAKIPRSGEGATQDGIMRAWHACLADVPLQVGMKASTVLFRDHEEPRSFEAHPRAVRGIARQAVAKNVNDQRRNRIVDGEWTVACRICDDEGLAVVWSDTARQACSGGVPEGFSAVDAENTVSVICTCDARERWTQSRLNLRSMNASMLVWNPFELDELVQWAQSRFVDPEFSYRGDE